MVIMRKINPGNSRLKGVAPFGKCLPVKHKGAGMRIQLNMYSAALFFPARCKQTERNILTIG